MNERQSGRTTKMLNEAIDLALQGKTVYTVYHAWNMAEYAFRLTRRLLRERRIDCDPYWLKRKINILPGTIIFGTKDSLEFSIDYIRIRGVSQDTPILVDHYVWEERTRILDAQE